jgi:TctA family transporter
MTLDHLPRGIQELLASTIKLLALVLVVAVLFGVAYGWLKGLGLGATVSLIVLVAQLWAFRSDVKSFLEKRAK